jgi:hypothetical protein
MISEMERGSIHGEEEVFTLALSLKIYVMDMDKCTGMKNHITKANGSKGHKMEKEKFGREISLLRKASMRMENSK